MDAAGMIVGADGAAVGVAATRNFIAGNACLVILARPDALCSHLA